jgi:hypothetical protein
LGYPVIPKSAFSDSRRGVITLTIVITES